MSYNLYNLSPFFVLHDLVFLACQAGAKLLYTGTTALGCKPYINAQRESCICTPKYQNSRGKDEF